MSSLSDRLRLALNASGMSQAELARRCHVKQPSVHGWLSGKARFLRGENLLRAAAALGANQLWLAEGKGPMSPDGNGLANVSSDDPGPDYVRLTLMDEYVAAGMGIGEPQFTREVVAHLDVLRAWAQRELRAPLDAVRVITARGDSMAPDVQDGDVLFVDTSVQRFVSDAIYIIVYAGRPMVKRLQARRDGSVLIRSSNPAYEPEIVPAGDVEQLHVAGRVLVAWTLRKF